MPTLQNMPTVEGFLLGDIVSNLAFRSRLEHQYTENENLRIWFIDDIGPDCRCNIRAWQRQLFSDDEHEWTPFRWRVEVYYRCSFAKTLFFDTEAGYIDFLEKYQPLCYQDYEWLRAHSDGYTMYQPTEVL